MAIDYKAFEQRKRDHIELAMMPANQSDEYNHFDAIILCHEALPDIDFNTLNIHSIRFNQATQSPFFVSSMTAGHTHAAVINKNLIKACATTGWAMGVGSQRRELTDKKAAFEWQALRKEFPTVSLFSNIGIAQLITTPITAIRALINALAADAVIIHCNPLQECIQPEGTPNFHGCYEALANLTAELDKPVVVKETGCGFSTTTLTRLNNLGVAAVDVAGLGGTHWGRIEGLRAKNDPCRQKTAHTFKNWGIDTPGAVRAAKSINPKFEIWGSGGVRSGLDAAKLCALGATSIGLAKPLLEASLKSSEAVIACMQTIEYELKVAMFCTGSATLMDLQEKLCP